MADDWIVSLFASAGTADFLENSLRGITSCGIDPSSVHVAIPANSAKELSGLIKKFGANTRIVEELIGHLAIGNMPTAYVEYGTPEFNRLMRARFPVIQALLRECDALVCADIDVAWIKNPLNYLGQVLKKYPMAFQTEASACFPPNFCAGFFAFLRSAPVNELLNAHITEFTLDRAVTMQVLLNEIIADNNRYLFNIFPLPEALFANGLLYSAVATRNGERLLDLGIEPFIFHANFTIGIENKRLLMKRAGAWRL